MAEAKTAVANKPTWVDLSTTDAAAAREFYSKVFGWKIEINPDPQYGGGGGGQVGGKQGAGSGAPRSPATPPPRGGSNPPDEADGPAQKETAPGRENDAAP